MDQAQELRFEKKKPQSVLNLSAFVLGLIITLYNLTNLEYSQNLLSTEILRVNDLPTQILPKNSRKCFSHIQVASFLHEHIYLNILYICISECLY